MKKFSEGPSSGIIRALQTWPILLARAENRQTMTYEMLSEKFGWEGQSAVRHVLGPIMYWCEMNGLPPLTSIVVNKNDGKPGLGFNTRGKPLSELHADVYKFDWYDLHPPTLKKLEEGAQYCSEWRAA